MRDKKEFFFDLETTGLESISCHILTLGGIVRVNGKIEDEIYIEMKPPTGTIIDPKILDLTGLKIDQIRGFPSQSEGYQKLNALFLKHINRFDKKDKFFTKAYNLPFDLSFLAYFYKVDMGDNYLFSFIGPKIDVMSLFNQYLEDNLETVKVANSKLGTACEHFGISLDAHNALNDVRATMELNDCLKFVKLKDGE